MPGDTGLRHPVSGSSTDGVFRLFLRRFTSSQVCSVAQSPGALPAVTARQRRFLSPSACKPGTKAQGHRESMLLRLLRLGRAPSPSSHPARKAPREPLQPPCWTSGVRRSGDPTLVPQRPPRKHQAHGAERTKPAAPPRPLVQKGSPQRLWAVCLPAGGRRGRRKRGRSVLISIWEKNVRAR